jgi:serine/threonine-protein kinase
MAGWSPVVFVLVAALAGLAAGALVSPLLSSGPAGASRSVLAKGARLDLDLTAEGELYRGLGPAAVLSPDGETVVFVEQRGGKRRLMARRLDQADARPLEGTEDALMPFFSPDGEWVGFFNIGSLMKVSLAGGSPLQICPAAGVQVRGAAWGPDDRIVFAADTSQSLSMVPATGGKPQSLTELGQGERSHRWPDFTGDGRSVLFLTQYHNKPYDDGSVERVDLATGERTILHRGGAFPRDAGPGRVAFARAGTIFVGSYGAGEGLVGAPSPLLTDVSMNTGDQSGGDGSAQFDMAASGSILYSRGRRSTVLGRLVVLDMAGHLLQELPAEPAEYFFPRVSPDGRWVAVTVSRASKLEAWLYGLEGQAPVRLTDAVGTADVGLWSSDGRWVFLAAGSDGPRNVVRTRVDGSTRMEVVMEGDNDLIPQDMSRDGRWLIVDGFMPETSWDVMKVAWDGDGSLPIPRDQLQPLVQSRYQETAPRLSPDGRWLAYASIESGVFEIYVCSFDNPRQRWKVSDRGGEYPMWGPDSDAVYYQRSRTLMAVRLAVTESGLVASPPEDLFEAPLLERPNDRVLDILPDGSGFAMVLEDESSEKAYPGEVTLVMGGPAATSR